MREFWAGNSDSDPIFFCPCIVNDDGSAVDDDKVSFPKVSFFSQPDTGFGEKSVSHITVTDKHVYPGEKFGFKPQKMFTDSYRVGWWRKCNLLTIATLNTVIETMWEGDPNSDPEQSSFWRRIKHTRPSLFQSYVTFSDREWWCSADYGYEYGMGGTHGVDHSIRQMYYDSGGKDAFKQYTLTPQAARRIYLSVADQHSVPAGLKSELYRNAMNSITCNTNTIANIKEVVDIFKDIKSGNIGSLISDIPNLLKKKQLKKAASASWLGYRYAYNTTKSDIQEYRDKLLPLLNQRPGTHIVRSGMSVKEGTAHCKVVYTDRALNGVQQLYTLLKRTGLCLDAYNVWDMVPLSFVVDWFLPIGDFLEDFSQNWVADTAIFDIATITTSWKWKHSIQDLSGWYEISYYDRDVTTEPPEFESYSEDPSTTTVLKRIVDAGALIIG